MVSSDLRTPNKRVNPTHLEALLELLLGEFFLQARAHPDTPVPHTLACERGLRHVSHPDHCLSWTGRLAALCSASLYRASLMFELGSPAKFNFAAHSKFNFALTRKEKPLDEARAAAGQCLHYGGCASCVKKTVMKPAAARLRELLSADGCASLPGCHDAMGAKLIEVTTQQSLQTFT